MSALDRLLRRRLLAQMAGMRHGRLVLRDPAGNVELGATTSAPGDLVVHVEVLRPRVLSRGRGTTAASAPARPGSTACGAATIWSALVRLLVRNRDLLDGMEIGSGAAWRDWRCVAGTRCNRNTRAGSRRNIAAHYDLGNEFFQLFLSRDLMYSSAYWAEARRYAGSGVHAQARLDLPQARSEARSTTWSRSVPAGAVSRCTRRGITAATSPPPRSRANSIALASERVAAAGLADRVTRVAEGLPRPRRTLRQAGFDRDDRGDRRVLARHLFRASSASC